MTKLRDGRRVLAAWIVGLQILAFPCLAFGTMMGAIGIRPETDLLIRVIVYSLPLLAEGAVAFVCAQALHARLASRLAYSPVVVALASMAGIIAATPVPWALLVAFGRFVGPDFDSDAFVPIAVAAAGLFFMIGSAVGVMIGSRPRPAPG